MHWKLLWLFLALGIDNSLAHWFFSSWTSSDFEWIVQPHLVLILLVYWQLQLRSDGIVFLGLLIGWLQDATADNILLGVHALSYALILLAFRTIDFRFLPEDPIRWMIVCEIGIVVNDIILYAIHWMFKQTSLTWDWLLIHQWIPNVIVHLFAMFIFISMRTLYQTALDENRFRSRS
jgi:rod shape-determining protein MreD